MIQIICSTSTELVVIPLYMLRQMMGSDLSYEDMMTSQKLRESYRSEVTGWSYRWSRLLGT